MSSSETNTVFQVLLTGCSRGLGHGLALELLSRGYEVTGLSRTTPSDLCTDSRFHFVACDLADTITRVDVLQNLPKRAWDLVILNAGILGQMTPLHQIPMHAAQLVMETNLWANKALLDHLLYHGSVRQVVAISSGASRRGNKGWGPYAMSKAALNILIETYADEWANTHFCSLAPGLVDTDMQEYLCEQVDPMDFPSVLRLRQARSTAHMPAPRIAAGQIVDALGFMLAQPSGSYLDIRQTKGT